MDRRILPTALSWYLQMSTPSFTVTLATLQAIAPPRERAIALQTALPHLQDHPTFLEDLKDFIKAESDPGVLSVAIRALAYYGKAEIETLNWFKTYAQYAQNPIIRALAVQELVRGWRDAFNVYEILSKCAFADRFRRQTPEEVNPRLCALTVMIEQYADVPQTWEFVGDRAENDNDPQVRAFAQAQLAQRQ